MSIVETKACQNCKKDFLIDSDDFVFYEKIKVPAPTFCPDCRMQRRMAYRNERALYKRTCDVCKNSIISAYPAKTHLKIYCIDCWYKDFWDPMDYGIKYDFTKSFFTQWKELQVRVPRPHLNNVAGAAMVNSEYTNCAAEMKDCYLVYGSMRDENCAYSHYLNDSRQCFDNLYVFKSENCYNCLDLQSCYNLMHSQTCTGCHDSYFLYDCKNCNDCIACVGLRNKSYCIFNEQYSKDDFLNKKAEMNLNSRKGLEAVKARYMKDFYYTLPRKFYHGQMNNGFSGDYISNTENTQQSFYIKNARDCKFVFWCNNAKDVFDYMSWGDVELMYECISNGYESYNCRFCDASWSNNKNLEYCSLCFRSSDLFGCIGLKNKQYCILNVQYAKEDYEILREKIIEEMGKNLYIDSLGNSYNYGEFPAIELSPFLYKDSVAQEHFPLSDERIIENKYRFQDNETRNHKITVESSDLPDSIDLVADDILTKVIGCAHGGKCSHQCTSAFKITAQELQFYRKFNITLPQLCYNCRHSERLLFRNPLKLWHRKCAKTGCQNEFETSYAPNSPEIVYCENCYNQEVA